MTKNITLYQRNLQTKTVSHGLTTEAGTVVLNLKIYNYLTNPFESITELNTITQVYASLPVANMAHNLAEITFMKYCSTVQYYQAS